jgi:hypothetical protein
MGLGCVGIVKPAAHAQTAEFRRTAKRKRLRAPVRRDSVLGCASLLALSGLCRRAAVRLTCSLIVLGLASPLVAQTVDPEVGRMLERALLDAEKLRKQMPTLEYDAKMRVQEWDARGRLRGTANAVAIMRPGDPKPMTFVSREVEGKVRLPEERSSSKDDEEDDKTTLHDFSAKHQMPERFDFQIAGLTTSRGSRLSASRSNQKRTRRKSATRRTGFSA